MDFEIDIDPKGIANPWLRLPVLAACIVAAVILHFLVMPVINAVVAVIDTWRGAIDALRYSAGPEIMDAWRGPGRPA